MQHRPYAPRPFALVYLILVVVGSGIAFAAYLGILWLQSLPALSSSFEEKEAQARLEAVKVALTTVAGLAAASGLYVGYRRQRVEESNSSREQDRVFTERFGAAAALLANENAAVRLAGLQSLARLSDDSVRDRYTCLSAICSYLRLPVRLIENEGSDEDPRLLAGRREQWFDPDEWDVRRNALRLLLERMEAEAPEPWDLRDAVLIEPDFTIAPINEGLDARRALIVGNATIPAWAFLSPTLFEECIFEGELNVVGSNPYLSFNGSRITKNFTFGMTNYSFTPEWGMMPTFERCTFSGGSQVLLDLTRYISEVNFLAENWRIGRRNWTPIVILPTERIMASNLTLNLTHSSFFGSVSLSSHAIDVAGADFSSVEELQFITYAGSAGMAPLEYDSLTTLWPEGFGDS